MNYLCLDLGLFPEFCNALWQKQGDTIWYYTPWQTAFPRFQDYAIGNHFEHLSKILYLWDYIDQADVIVNFDVHFNDLIAYLRKKYPDKPIYGAGKGEVLENDRWGLKKILKSIKLPLQRAEKVRGITQLRNYIKSNPNKYVKINIFRNDISSFHAKDYKSSELLFDEIESAFGPFKEEFDFIVEDIIDSDVEIGFDGFFDGTDYAKPYLIGYEHAKTCYIGFYSNTLPIQLKETLDKLKPVLQQLNYRGAISTEEKIVSKTEHYFLDICARLPAPCGAVHLLIKNFPQLIYSIAKGKSTGIDIPYKYVGAAPIECEHAEKNWVELLVKDRQHIKFRSVAGLNGRYFAVKGNPSVAVVVAGGNTIDDVIKQLERYANSIEGYGLSLDTLNGLIKIKEIVKKGETLGIRFNS